MKVHMSKKTGEKLLRFRVEFFVDLRTIALLWIWHTKHEEKDETRKWIEALTPPDSEVYLRETASKALWNRGACGVDSLESDLSEEYKGDVEDGRVHQPTESFEEYLVMVEDALTEEFPKLCTGG